MEESGGLSAGAGRCLCSSWSLLLPCSGWTGLASVCSGGFSEGRAADFTSLLSLVLGGASGIRFVSGNLTPEGEEEVTQKCTQTPSDREQDPDGTIQ